MRYGEHGAVCKLPPDGGLYEVVGLEVHRGRGLVQNEQLGLPQQSSRLRQGRPIVTYVYCKIEVIVSPVGDHGF